MPGSDFTALLERPYVVPQAETQPPPAESVAVLVEQLRAQPALAGRRPRDIVESLCAQIDLLLTAQINAILHHTEFQALEATWRGLHFLVRNTESGPLLKIKILNIGKRDLSRTLRKFRGTAWDRSAIFKKIYEEEYGQFGG